MLNPVLTGPEEITSTAATFTMGYKAGQQVPPRTLVVNPTGGMTVNLPQINPTFNSSEPVIPGTGVGYLLTIRNISSQTITVAAASGTSGTETLNDSVSIATNASHVGLVTTSAGWYIVTG